MTHDAGIGRTREYAGMSVSAKIEDHSLILSFTGAIDQSTADEVRSSLSSLDGTVYTKVLFDVTAASSVDCQAWGEILSLSLIKVNKERAL